MNVFKVKKKKQAPEPRQMKLFRWLQNFEHVQSDIQHIHLVFHFRTLHIQWPAGNMLKVNIKDIKRMEFVQR